MSSHDSFAALRRANPRNDPGFESDVRASAALEKRIMTTDPAPSASRRRLWRRTPRRRLTLIAVTGAIILLGCTAAYGELRSPEPADLKPVPQPPPVTAPESVIQSKGFLNWKQYCAEYDAWTHKIALPLGATWRGGDPGNKDCSVSVGAGALDTVWEGMGHWTIEWIAATKAGNDVRAARAEAWVVQLRALLNTGNDEMRSAMDPQTTRLLDAAIAEAKVGHFEKLSDFVVPYTVPFSTGSTIH
jgi:hypothetical protein